MKFWAASLFTVATAFSNPSDGHPSSRGRVPLGVTVYDRSSLDPGTRKDLFAGTARILRAAGIDVTWVDGNLDSREAMLLQYPDPPRKGREVEVSCRARADIALELLPMAPKFVKSSIVGVAVPLASEGLNVRLFTDRAEAVAYRENLTLQVVGAHALAHEIGHILLRDAGHAASGLMAGNWADHEYRRMRDGLLLFSAAQSLRMRQAIERSGCPVTAGAAELQRR